MRVLVERSTISDAMLERITRELPTARVLVLERGELEQQVREDDVVITCAADLAALEVRKTRVRFGKLSVGPLSATYAGAALPLQRLDLLVLYELAANEGRHVSRDELLQRCWPKKPTRERTVDVAIHRLRQKIEAATNLRLMTQRALGYRLALPDPVKKRVLVVEDEKPMQKAYARLFVQLGVEADFADTVGCAKSMVQSQDYAAYLIDLNMPGGKGSDVIGVIQQRNPLASIMIITGRDDDEAIGFSEQYGVAYACKPFDPQALKRFVMRTVLGKNIQ